MKLFSEFTGQIASEIGQSKTKVLPHNIRLLSFKIFFSVTCFRGSPRPL